MRLPRLILASVVSLGVVQGLRDDLSSTATAAVSAYRITLAAVERSQPNATVSEAFQRVLDVRRALLTSDAGLEDLTEDAYERLRRSVKGILIDRFEALSASPDPKFFQELAERYGDPPDRAFFSEYAATYTRPDWPSYIVQQGDFSGCIDYGNGELVARYRGWVSYRGVHPQTYAEEVRRRIEEIEGYASAGGCSCGPSGPVLKELEAFSRFFPDSPAHERVLELLKAVQENRSQMRFNCISG
jgi:hypothetical protein